MSHDRWIHERKGLVADRRSEILQQRPLNLGEGLAMIARGDVRGQSHIPDEILGGCKFPRTEAVQGRGRHVRAGPGRTLPVPLAGLAVALSR